MGGMQGILFTVGLTVLASLSPLLTFASLWQRKEWRIDRLREHFRHEGWWRQVFGLVRPLVIAGCIALSLVDFFVGFSWVFVALIAMSIINVMQIVIRRQPRPVWTQKAVVIALGSMLLTAFFSLILWSFDLFTTLPFLALLQPFVVAIVWAGLLPLDTILKQRVMRRAKDVRAKHAELTVIGITGSVGKTTTKELLAHILGDRAAATPAHVNSEMGVSAWLNNLLTKESVPNVLIVEMGAYRSGEIRELCEIAQPSIGILTYVGMQHVGLFGSQEALFNAKAELIESLPENGHAFLNGDNELCVKMASRAKCPVTLVGTGGNLNVEAFDIEETPTGIRFKLDQKTFTVPLHGTHNVTNVLLAIKAAEEAGMKMDEIQKRLESFTPPQHTFSVREERGVTILDDTHNSSTESVQAAINWARSQPLEHKTLLIHGLIELGEAQDRAHAELGTLAAPVFKRVIFRDKRSALSFAKGYGREVEILSKETLPVQQGTLLVCTGRMSGEKIRSLLP